jgi:hypothetical protein
MIRLVCCFDTKERLQTPGSFVAMEPGRGAEVNGLKLSCTSRTFGLRIIALR